MPHCIIEYAEGIKSQIGTKELIDAVHIGIKKTAIFDIQKLKSRAIAYEHYNLVEADFFIHVTLKILSGRSFEIKKLMSENILSELKLMPLASVSVTVDICDIDGESYSKFIR